MIEYANLFMGQDIDLKQIGQLEPLLLTLQHEIYLKEACNRYRPHYRKGRII